MVLNSTPTPPILFCGGTWKPHFPHCFARRRSTGERSERPFFFSTAPSAFGTSNLSNGVSAATAAQSSWDLALRTAEGSNGTAVAEQELTALARPTASVELWAAGLLPLGEEGGCPASSKAVAMVIPTATAAVLQLPQQHSPYQLWVTKLALAFCRYSLLSITATFFPFHQIFQHICNQFFGLRSLCFESLLFFWQGTG